MRSPDTELAKCDKVDPLALVIRSCCYYKPNSQLLEEYQCFPVAFPKAAQLS